MIPARYHRVSEPATVRYLDLESAEVVETEVAKATGSTRRNGGGRRRPGSPSRRVGGLTIHADRNYTEPMEMSARQLSSLSPSQESSLISWTQAIYALHAFSLVMGIIGVATVVGAFLTGWPSIIAVVLNYVKRSEVRGTWLESHFRWQIRTFWFGLLWVVLCVLFVVFTLGLGILVVWIPIVFVSLWFIYRIVRGWMALERTMEYT